MRTISWLHVSDIHMRVRDAWSQDVVLTAMCERAEKLHEEGLAADFVLATGDVAFREGRMSTLSRGIFLRCFPKPRALRKSGYFVCRGTTILIVRGKSCASKVRACFLTVSSSSTKCLLLTMISKRPGKNVRP